MGRPRLNPILRKRFVRFRAMRRAWWSLCLLTGLYGLSLVADVICNDRPLYVRYEGAHYFPIVQYYPEHTFVEDGRQTRTDYVALNATPRFSDNPDNFMVFPIIPHSPQKIVSPESLNLPEAVTVAVQREARVGTVDFNANRQVLRANNAHHFFDVGHDRALRSHTLTDTLPLPPAFNSGIDTRFANEAAPSQSYRVTNLIAGVSVDLVLSPFEPLPRPPRYLRMTLREHFPEEAAQSISFRVKEEDDIPRKLIKVEALFAEDQLAQIRQRVQERFDGSVSDHVFNTLDGMFRVQYDKETVTYPFRPTRGHPFGLDSSGRDVLAQILYALRTSMSFGLLLVIATMTLGISVGAVQGYFGGLLDITVQRLIEIWSALPFLYIIILLGSIYGRSFTLLLICYGLFNWIGISYYIRAEFLKLRHFPFVEASRVLGLGHHAIIFKHILPNALVPVITFFPFSLVSAIGALAALDYLGFGLPPTTPSWGALLAQAQEFRFAWWLVLYPSLALFLVILLGVFVGEGVRAAFDPRAEHSLE